MKRFAVLAAIAITAFWLTACSSSTLRRELVLAQPAPTYTSVEEACQKLNGSFQLREDTIPVGESYGTCIAPEGRTVINIVSDRKDEVDTYRHGTYTDGTDRYTTWNAYQTFTMSNGKRMIIHDDNEDTYYPEHLGFLKRKPKSVQ